MTNNAATAAPATTAPTTHSIKMLAAPAYRTEHYGVTSVSAYVYRTSKSSYPTRVEAWSNVNRPNPRNGQPVRFGDYGPIDGGKGVYLDPSNNATDAPTSHLLSTECISITAGRNGTGHADSGQVWAPDGPIIRPGDLIALTYPDGSTETFTAVFTGPGCGNGHGRLIATELAA